MVEVCSSAEWRPAAEKAMAFAQAQVQALVERDPDFYPMYTEGGKWRHSRVGLTGCRRCHAGCIMMSAMSCAQFENWGSSNRDCPITRCMSETNITPISRCGKRLA